MYVCLQVWVAWWHRRVDIGVVAKVHGVGSVVLGCHDGDYGYIISQAVPLLCGNRRFITVTTRAYQ